MTTMYESRSPYAVDQPSYPNKSYAFRPTKHYVQGSSFKRTDPLQVSMEFDSSSKAAKPLRKVRLHRTSSDEPTPAVCFGRPRCLLGAAPMCCTARPLNKVALLSCAAVVALTNPVYDCERASSTRGSLGCRRTPPTL